MAQRILEPGEIETLAQRSIPRVRVPARATVFARRAGGCANSPRTPASGNTCASSRCWWTPSMRRWRICPCPFRPRRTSRRRPTMACRHPARRVAPHEAWLETLSTLCGALAAHAEFPSGVAGMVSRVRQAPRGWAEGQADALLRSGEEAIDARGRPLVMAALQVNWTALAASFAAEASAARCPGLCPLCGSQPVASVVYAQSPYQGYRYLHCALCATEWHRVRVQCSRCGASARALRTTPPPWRERGE